MATCLQQMNPSHLRWQSNHLLFLLLIAWDKIWLIVNMLIKSKWVESHVQQQSLDDVYQVANAIIKIVTKSLHIWHFWRMGNCPHPMHFHCVYLQEMVWLCPNAAACKVAGVEMCLLSIESMHKTWTHIHIHGHVCVCVYTKYY